MSNELFTKLEKSCNEALGTGQGVELRKMSANDFVEYAVAEINKAAEEADGSRSMAKSRLQSLQLSIAVAKDSLGDGRESAGIPVFDEAQALAQSDAMSKLESTVDSLKAKLSDKSDGRGDKKKEEEEDKVKAEAEAEAKKKEEEEAAAKAKEEEDKAKADAEAKKQEEEAKKSAVPDDIAWPNDMARDNEKIVKSENYLDWGRDPA